VTIFGILILFFFFFTTVTLCYSLLPYPFYAFKMTSMLVLSPVIDAYGPY